MTIVTRKAYQKLLREQCIEQMKKERLERFKNVTSLIKSQMKPLSLPYHKESETAFIRNYITQDLRF
jgi:hypothetical protein